MGQSHGAENRRQQKCRRWPPAGGSARRPGCSSGEVHSFSVRLGLFWTWGARAPAGNVRVAPGGDLVRALGERERSISHGAVDPADGIDADVPVDRELLRRGELDVVLWSNECGAALPIDPMGGMMEEHHQEDGGNGQCRDLEPVLEGLHEGDALHPAARDAQGHNDAEDDDPDPLRAPEGHLQGQPPPPLSCGKR